MKARIVVLPGDGIGPEVTQSAVNCLQAVAAAFGHEFTFEEHPIGGQALELTGSPLPPATLQACRSAVAVLLGAVGAPRWEGLNPALRPERGLLDLRQGLGVYANLRPVRLYPGLEGISPLKPDRLQNVDLLIVRELTGGLYFGQPKGRSQQGDLAVAVDTLVYRQDEIERVLDLAFRLARGRRGKVSSVDKANVLESSRLWREVAEKVAGNYPGVALEHVLVDTAAMRLVARASSFDVIVTENLFGDILSDEAAVLTGSLGMLPSASLGSHPPGLYEPVHGSAPDIAGKGIANPLGAVLSAAMLLHYSLQLPAEALALEQAVARVVERGQVTPDVGGNLGSGQVTQALLDHLAQAPRRAVASPSTRI
jgi:3-isopropylmalate dehydrogenase